MIKFQTNLPTDQTPWMFDLKYFNTIPSSSGVYIVGVRKQVSDQGEKFCPLLVGQANDLRKRLQIHYSIRPDGYLNSRKEIFDLVGSDIRDVYNDINLWNPNWVCAKPKDKKLTHKIVGWKDTLLWHFHADFYRIYHGISDHHFSTTNDGNDGHDKDLWILESINSPDSIKLLKRIQDNKSLLKQRFFYVYATESDFGDVSSVLPDLKSNLERVETIVKYKLSRIGLHTYAIARRWNEICSDKNLILPDLDLGCLRGELVNVNGTSHPNPLRV